MLGLMKIDNNEAIVVRTTMASQQFGISPDIILRKIAYSHGRFGKGERKFRFKVQGGGYQQANCLGVYLCCLPATLKQELKTLLEVPAQLPAPAQAQLPPPDVEHVAQNPAPAQLSALLAFDVRRDFEAGDIARNPLQPVPGCVNTGHFVRGHSQEVGVVRVALQLCREGCYTPQHAHILGKTKLKTWVSVMYSSVGSSPTSSALPCLAQSNLGVGNMKSVNPTIVTHKTCSSQKQSSLLEQSSMQQSVHEPLCFVEHTKLLMYRPSGSKLHFEITGGDLNCLHPHEYLNDKIINFYLTYLLCDKFVNIKERVHIFSSFFLGKLMESPKDRKSNVHDGVKSWTRHVDIFSKEYIVMPVCLRSHWFVAIVCFPEKFESDNAPDKLEVDSEDVALSTQDLLTANPSPTRPCIIVLDSLGIKRAAVLKSIQSYLTEEWKVKRSTEKNFSSMPQSYPSVPLQTNNFDCGIYVLQYVEGFLKSVTSSSSLPQSQEEWASDEDLSQKRKNIRSIIETLSASEQDRDRV
ncbi:hypothetical protein EMCRGX_G028652 [Ephydatia muelleri]